MKTWHFVKKVRFAVNDWPLARIRPLTHITSEYPSLFARNIAVLTEALKNEAEKTGGLKNLDSLPGPKTFPLVGNLDYLKTGFLKIHDIQLKDAKKYGPMYKDQIFMSRGIVVQDPDICKEIYRAEAKLPYRDFSRSIGELLRERQRLQLPKSFIDL